ncbi:hypothetical protein BDZ97DRAFT_118479 [Flammula alnicola]|nr:hypothetical protein BDZ97DRAFT_118479 [Flammula alnicola]
MAYTSAFDDLASLDPLQLQPTTTPITPTTPTPTQAKARQKTSSAPSSSSSSFIYNNNAAKASSSSASSIRERNVDIFATLFSPSTPRASPVLDSLPLPGDGSLMISAAQPQSSHNAKPPPTQHRRTESTSSQMSDFGAFVSVSAFDDPLSMVDMQDFDDAGDLQAPMVATPTNPTTINNNGAATPSAVSLQANADFSSLPPPRRPLSRSLSSSRSASRSVYSTESTNPTMSFFDQFAQDATKRSSARSSLLLDELLLHEDDPLYFLKDEKPKEKDKTTEEDKRDEDEEDFDNAEEENTKELPKTPSTATTLQAPLSLPLVPTPHPRQLTQTQADPHHPLRLCLLKPSSHPHQQQQ